MNKQQRTPPGLPPDLLEARLAARLATALRERSETLPPDIEERLRFAREQALQRARRADDAAVLGGGGSAAVLGRLGAWWPRLGAMLPVLVLVAGAAFIVDSQQREEAAIAAEIDAELLADDLPPEAYADPGFAAFLKLQQP